MKKVLFLFLALGVGKMFSQSAVPPFPEDFGTTGTFPASFESANSVNSTYSFDWIIDDASSAPSIPVCNVGGSTGGSKLFGQNSGTGTFEEVRTVAINTNTFVGIKVAWNALKLSSSSPAVAFAWSNDAGASWNTIAYTNTSGTNTWGVIAPISLPAAASGTMLVLRWSYTTNGTGAYVAIDDVQVTGTPSPAFYYHPPSGPLHSTTSWWTVPGGTGFNPASFLIDNQNFFLINDATLTAAWTVGGTSTFLNIGDGTSGNKANLTIPSTFALTMSGTAVMNVTNNSTLTIQNTTFPSIANIGLLSGSTVDFAQNSAVTLWLTTFQNLTLSGTGSKQQPAGNVTVSGNFIVGASTTYIMTTSNTRTTRLSGPITCNGSITTANSHINIDGSGAIGTLNFAGGANINNFTLNRANVVMTLGSDFTIGGTTNLTNGGLSLSSRLLTLNGPIVFPAASSNGSITGSATSSLTIGSTGSITNNLLMGQGTSAARTLNAFNLNRTSTTLALGNDIIINNSFFTNGTMDLNGRSLSLNGPITFPASASNGVFIGSSTSTLVIGAVAGAITNPLFMSQTNSGTKTLGQLATTRGSSTLTLGNDLIVSGSLNATNGFIDLNGTVLTVNGVAALWGSNIGRV